MIGELSLSLAMRRFSPGAGGNTESARMVFTVLGAFEHVKANLPSLFSAKFRPGKSFYRTGIDADMAFSARPVERGACFQGSIGQNGYKAGSGPEAIGQEKTAFANPSHPCQVSSQLVRKDSLQLAKVVGGRAWDRERPEPLRGEPASGIIGQKIQSPGHDLVNMVPV
jgi:hypothetical protein